MPATADDFLKINYAMMRPKTMTVGAKGGKAENRKAGVVRKSQKQERKLPGLLKDYEICKHAPSDHVCSLMCGDISGGRGSKGLSVV